MLAAHIAENKITQRQLIQARARTPEVLDPIPLAGPIDHGPPSMRDLVQEYVREAFSQHAHENDLGTFEEEDDFEPEDEDLLNMSGFEVSEFPLEDEAPMEDPSPPPPAAEPGEAPTEPPAPEAEASQPPSNPT